jgi:galactonate dehydratase
MKITSLETFTVGAVWKNWLLVRVNTDEGIHGIGEGTMNGFIKTGEACIHELEHLVIGHDPRQINSLFKKLLETIGDGGHIHRLATAAIETACWDILGKALGVPIDQLLGGKVRDSILGYANGWYRTERNPESFVKAAQKAVNKGFHAVKLDPFGTAQGFIEDEQLDLAYEILSAIREAFPQLRILIDVHARFTPAEAVRAAQKMAPLDLYWWEEPTTREREQPTNEVAEKCPIRVASGEAFDSVAQFFTLAVGGGVNIWQPEPMSLGGIGPTLAVAHLAQAHGSWIAPHQSGGPVATAVCLQLAACLPNFLIQEHFDPFNASWTQNLVTWSPEINPQNGHLSLPQGPGLGLDLNQDVIKDHPYDVTAFLNINEEGWEQRIGH